MSREEERQGTFSQAASHFDLLCDVLARSQLFIILKGLLNFLLNSVLRVIQKCIRIRTYGRLPPDQKFVKFSIIECGPRQPFLTCLLFPFTKLPKVLDRSSLSSFTYFTCSSSSAQNLFMHTDDLEHALLIVSRLVGKTALLGWEVIHKNSCVAHSLPLFLLCFCETLSTDGLQVHLFSDK